MKSYVANVSHRILTLLGMSIVIFALLRLAPGDIVASSSPRPAT